MNCKGLWNVVSLMLLSSSLQFSKSHFKFLNIWTSCRVNAPHCSDARPMLFCGESFALFRHPAVGYRGCKAKRKN